MKNPRGDKPYVDVGVGWGRGRGVSDGLVKKKIRVVVGVYKGKRGGALKGGAMTTHCIHVEIT